MPSSRHRRGRAVESTGPRPADSQRPEDEPSSASVGVGDANQRSRTRGLRPRALALAALVAAGVVVLAALVGQFRSWKILELDTLERQTDSNVEPGSLSKPKSEGPASSSHADDELQAASRKLYLNVVAEKTKADGQFHRSSAGGDLAGVRSALRLGANVCSLSARHGRTALHAALMQRQATLATQSQHLPGDYEDIIAEIVTHPGFQHCSAYLCPVYFAVHYRNLVALREILSKTPAKALQLCLLQRDLFNLTILHSAAASRASGFARFFMRQLAVSAEAVGQAKDVEQVRRYSPPAEAVLQLLNLSMDPVVTSLQAKADILTFEALSSAVGHQDVVMLVNAARKREDHVLHRLLAATDGWGNTVLHVAAAGGRLHLVRFLLSIMEPCAATARNIFNQSALDLAATGGFQLVVKALSAHETSANDSCRCRNDSVLPSKAKKSTLADDASVSISPRESPERELESGKNKIGARVEQSWNGRSSQTDTEAPHCQFTVLPSEASFTEESFWDLCVAQRKPVLIKKLVRSWTTLANWQKESFLKSFGKQRVSVNTVPYGDQYGHRHSVPNMRLDDYVAQYMLPEAEQEGAGTSQNSSSSEQKEAAYVFDGVILHQNAKMWDLVQLPSALEHVPVILRQLIVGPAKSGSPPHFHGLAVNFLVAGRKRWLLTPPATAYFYRGTAKDWFDLYDQPTNQSESTSANAFNSFSECTQEAGDALVVPDSWGHAVVNLQNSVAVAVELANANVKH